MPNRILGPRLKSRVAFAVACVLSLLASISVSSAQTDSPVPEITVAFIGDQGSGSSADAVLQLIKNQGADMVIHGGDFDYSSNPTAWDKKITTILGADFPYFASIGNHDTDAWSGTNGYRAKLQARLNRIPDAQCSGDLGVKSTCTYKGLFFILSGVGTTGSGHEAYLADQLAQTDAIWRICSWHKNQRLMQVGGKSDEVGWSAYEACREGGAIIATAHEHSYARTHLLDHVGTQHVASTANTLQLEEGKTFVFHSGLGGSSIRDQELDGPWWASIYTSTQGANYGALFCTFNANGVANRASCYFMDIDGVIPDQFEVISAVTGGVNNTPPVAADDTAVTDEDTAVVINVLNNDTDGNGGSLSLRCRDVLDQRLLVLGHHPDNWSALRPALRVAAFAHGPQ
jgi:3',5'-cyclic AMP phosphodiesterase CpdA